MNYEDCFLSKGIYYAVNAKIEIMKELLKVPEMREEIVDFFENQENKRIYDEVIDDLSIGMVKSLVLSEADLEGFFDKMIWKKFLHADVSEMSDVHQYYYANMMKGFEKNKEVQHIDVINLMTYLVISSSACIKQLYHEIEQHLDRADLYEGVLNSSYAEDGFEYLIDAKYIPAGRLFRGIMLIFSNNPTKEMYDLIMRILYAGYKKVKKDLKGLKYFGASQAHEARKYWFSKQYNMVVCAAVQAFMFIVCQDLGIEIRWDYKLLNEMEMIIHYEKELAGQQEEAYCSGTEIQAEHKELLNKLTEKYESYASLFKVIYENGEKSEVDHLTSVAKAFDFSIRKLEKYELTEEEVSHLLACKEKWNTKDYLYSMSYTVLCKYVRELEKIVSKVDIFDNYKNVQFIEREIQKLNEQKERVISEKEKEHLKEKNKDKILLEQERMIERLKTELAEQKNQIDTNNQELTELRNFAYSMSDSCKDDVKVATNSIDYWRREDVLMIGGHINWQKKVRDIFPNWKFFSSEKNMSADLLKDRKYIVCNAAILSHATYYKLIAERTTEQRIIYVHSNNMDLFLEELDRAIMAIM